MAEEKKDSKSKVIIVLIIVILVLIGAGVTAIVLLLGQGGDSAPAQTEAATTAAQTEDTKPKGPAIGYEAGAIALDADSLQKAVDEAFQKTEDGYITLDFFNEAYSTDGENFECRIGNDPSNTSDMYIAIYLDDDVEQQIYLSGLIRPGEGIASFKSDIKFDKGAYDTVLVLTQVMDDHETLKAQTSVALTLFVN